MTKRFTIRYDDDRKVWKVCQIGKARTYLFDTREMAELYVASEGGTVE